MSFLSIGSPAKVYDAVKRGRKLLFLFSSHSVKAGTWYEMTAIIKLAQSERQALLCPWKHTLLHKHAHSQAFTSADRVKASHRANETCWGNWIRFVSDSRKVWHLSTWLQIPDGFLSSNLIRPDRTGLLWIRLNLLFYLLWLVSFVDFVF